MLSTNEIARKLEELKESFTLEQAVLDEIHDSGNREIMGISEEDFIIFAHMYLPYKGNIPEDYRVLNAFISDFVAKNRAALEEVLSEPVIEYLQRDYGDGDLSDITGGISDYFWEQQIDYLPMVDPDNQVIYFDIELNFVMESDEDDESEDTPPDEA